MENGTGHFQGGYGAICLGVIDLTRAMSFVASLADEVVRQTYFEPSCENQARPVMGDHTHIRFRIFGALDHS